MKARKPPRGMVSMTEAADRLGVARQRVYQLERMGLLTVVRRDGQMWVPLAAISDRLGREARLNSGCLSTRDVAEHFGVKPNTVRGWRNQGLLTTVKLNNRLCFDPDEVEAFTPPSQRTPTAKETHDQTNDSTDG